MTQDQKHIARVLFKLKVLTSDGQTFEDLFSKVMSYSNKNFIQVKPQGRIGDRKNDGFDSTNGSYYQVYAPEKLQLRENKILNKLKKDFEGLFNNWNNQVPIKQFYYVLNDKYKGVFPTVIDALTHIKINKKLSVAKPFTPKDIEELVFQLEDSSIYEIVGYISPNLGTEVIQLAALGDVVEYLIYNMDVIGEQGKLIVPDFDEKLQFNKLSDFVSNLLKNGNYQTYVLESFFQARSHSLKEDLRNVFSKLYQDALLEFKEYDAIEKSDVMFYSILKKAYPNQKLIHEQAVLALMAYYFEACDIFEEPVKDTK